MDHEDRIARKRRVDVRYVEWRLANQNKPKYGTRAEVVAGKCYCTRGRLVKDDLFVDSVDGKIKSRAMSNAMQRTWEDKLFGV